MFIRLDDGIAVAGQIAPADIAEAARQGFALVVNNRPDGEQPGQPSGAELAAAAQAAGIGYVAVPITHTGIAPAQVDAMRAALESAGGPVLAFCRSGTRSTYVWALARAAAGDDADGLIARAAAGGYDIAGLRPALEAARAAR